MVSWPLIGAGGGAVVLVLGIILGFAVFPPLVDDKIAEATRIEDGTSQFDRWKTLPQPVHFKVYIMSCTNPDSVQLGAKPDIKEMGPYIYKEYKSKTNISFSSNHEKVEYVDVLSFEFDAAASAPLREEDIVTVPSVFMITAFQFANKGAASNTMNINFRQMFNNPTNMFLATSVKNLLWDGIEFCQRTSPVVNNLCDNVAMQGKDSPTIIRTEDGSLSFAFFRHKNGTSADSYKIWTGTSETEKTRILTERNTLPNNEIWPNKDADTVSICNTIRGTDGTGWPPFVKSEGSISSFSSDVCHSVNLYYNSEVEYKGITGYRFAVNDEFILNVGEEYKNECFCVKQATIFQNDTTGCMLKGAIDMSACLHAPIMLTRPHMYGADPELQNSVTGQKPVDSLHGTYVDVEPNTGNPLRGASRIQLNIIVQYLDRMTFTRDLSDSLVPILWVDEGIELNDDMIQLLNDELFSVLVILDVVTWVLIGLGIAGLAGCLIWYFIQRRK